MKKEIITYMKTLYYFKKYKKFSLNVSKLKCNYILLLWRHRSMKNKSQRFISSSEFEVLFQMMVYQLKFCLCVSVTSAIIHKPNLFKRFNTDLINKIKWFLWLNFKRQTNIIVAYYNVIVACQYYSALDRIDSVRC